jgi:hypothetical protein
VLLGGLRLAGGAGDEGRDDVGGVAVEADAGAVVAHGALGCQPDTTSGSRVVDDALRTQRLGPTSAGPARNRHSGLAIAFD